MSDGISVRQLTVDDWQKFAATRLEALQKYPQFFGSSYAKESAYTQEDWQKWLGRSDSAEFGLYDGSQMIGVTGVMAHRDNAEHGILIASYIRPDYQGRGLSAKLYKARLDWAAAYRPWKKLVVGHREDNEASRRANQKHGFSYTHRVSESWPDGKQMDNLYYELDLEQMRRKQ